MGSHIPQHKLLVGAAGVESGLVGIVCQVNRRQRERLLVPLNVQLIEATNHVVVLGELYESIAVNRACHACTLSR